MAKNNDQYQSKDPNREIFYFLTYGLIAYITIIYLYALPETTELITPILNLKLIEFLNSFLVLPIYLVVGVKIIYLFSIFLFARTDDFQVKRKIVLRYEKKSIGYINRHLLIVLLLVVLSLALSPTDIVYTIILSSLLVALLINRDFFISLAFKYPDKKNQFLKAINAHFHEETNDDAHGYDSKSDREKKINNSIIGHNKDHLHFYHNFENSTGIEVMYNGNPRRGNGVIGTNGSGKTFSVLDPMAIQTIENLKIPMVQYDFKFPNMGRVAFKSHLRAVKTAKENGQVYKPKFATTTFSQQFIHNTFRMNPISSETILTENDGDTYMKTFLQCFNKKWQEDDSDFWFKSTYAYGGGAIKAFSKHLPGWTFAHLLDFFRKDYEEQIRCLINLEDDEVNAKIEAVRKPVVEGKGADQVTGIFSTLQNEIGAMHNRHLFYAISAAEGGKAEAPLFCNDPNNPYQLIIGNHNKYDKIYGPIISLYYAIIFNVCNLEKMLPLHALIDEAATLNLFGVDKFINTGRSNGMITTLGFQGFSQSDFIYGEKLARVILTSLGNWYYGQINDDKAIEQVVKSMGSYKKVVQNKSLGGGKQEPSISTVYAEEKFIRYEEVPEFDQGYFVGKMAEGDSKRYMGQMNVDEFEEIMNSSKSQVLPLSPGVKFLFNNGDISKDDIQLYYKGHEGATTRINSTVDKYSESEYQRIKRETTLFLLGQV